MANKKKQIGKRKVFSSPGTLEYVGKEIEEESKMRFIEFDINFEKILAINEIYKPEFENSHVKWLEVDGSHDATLVAQIGKVFNLHPLVQEDILNTFSKPKIEFFDNDQIFIIMKTINFNEKALEIDTEQVVFVLGNDNYLISFQERNGTDVFEPIIGRIKASIGKTRRNNADYLLFSLMDVIIDSYFIALESINETLDNIEDEIFIHPHNIHQSKLYTIKRQLGFFRKHVFPLRDMIGAIVNESYPNINASTIVYFRDLQDHVIQILDSIETNRETAESMMSFYLSQLSNRMNSVMKTLTVFTAVFMPLSFIVGLYGMNFVNMPELRHQNGYFITLGVLVIIAVALYIYFKWKKYV